MKCKHCENEFEPKVTRKKRVYCSEKCQQSAWRKKISEHNYYTIECLSCGTAFKTTGASRIFCSSVCSKKYNATLRLMSKRDGNSTSTLYSVLAKQIKNFFQEREQYVPEIIEWLKKIKAQKYRLTTMDIMYLLHYYAVVEYHSDRRELTYEKMWNTIVLFIKKIKQNNEMANLDNEKL